MLAFVRHANAQYAGFTANSLRKEVKDRKWAETVEKVIRKGNRRSEGY